MTDMSYHGGGFVLGDIDREDGIALNSAYANLLSHLPRDLFSVRLRCGQCRLSSRT